MLQSISTKRALDLLTWIHKYRFGPSRIKRLRETYPYAIKVSWAQGQLLPQEFKEVASSAFARYPMGKGGDVYWFFASIDDRDLFTQDYMRRTR